MPSGSIPHGQERTNAGKRHMEQSPENDSYDLALARRVGSRHAVIPHDAVVDRNLSDRQFRVYALMCLHANKDDEAWPRQDTLAAIMGVSQQYISRVVRELAELGYVEVRRLGFPARNHYFVPVKPNGNARKCTENQGENQENAADISDANADNLPVTTTRVVTERIQLQPPEVVPVTTSGGCANNSVLEQCSSSRSRDSFSSTSPAPLARPRGRFDQSALRRDPLFIAVTAFLPEPVLDAEWRQWAAMLNQLHRGGVRAEDIPTAVKGWQLRWDISKLTLPALVHHWAEIREGKSSEQIQAAIRHRHHAQAERDADARRAAQREEFQRLYNDTLGLPADTPLPPGIYDPAGGADSGDR